MENLVDDALLAIFSHLTYVELEAVACVCTRWRRLVGEMCAREPSRTAVQLGVYAPPPVAYSWQMVGSSFIWQIDELLDEMRRDVRRMMTRPAFGLYVMSSSLASHVMWQRDKRKHHRPDQQAGSLPPPVT